MMLSIRLIRLKTLDSPDKSGRIGGGAPRISTEGGWAGKKCLSLLIGIDIGQASKIVHSSSLAGCGKTIL